MPQLKIFLLLATVLPVASQQFSFFDISESNTLLGALNMINLTFSVTGQLQSTSTVTLSGLKETGTLGLTSLNLTGVSAPKFGSEGDWNRELGSLTLTVATGQTIESGESVMINFNITNTFSMQGAQVIQISGSGPGASFTMDARNASSLALGTSWPEGLARPVQVTINPSVASTVVLSTGEGLSFPADSWPDGVSPVVTITPKILRRSGADPCPYPITDEQNLATCELSLAGSICTFGPSGITFKKDVTLMMKFDQDQLLRTSNRRLSISKQSGVGSSEWSEYPSTVSGEEVTTLIRNFSTYAVTEADQPIDRGQQSANDVFSESDKIFLAVLVPIGSIFLLFCTFFVARYLMTQKSVVEEGIEELDDAEIAMLEQITGSNAQKKDLNAEYFATGNDPMNPTARAIFSANPHATPSDQQPTAEPSNPKPHESMGAFLGFGSPAKHETLQPVPQKSREILVNDVPHWLEEAMKKRDIKELVAESGLGKSPPKFKKGQKPKAMTGVAGQPLMSSKALQESEEILFARQISDTIKKSGDFTLSADFGGADPFNTIGASEDGVPNLMRATDTLDHSPLKELSPSAPQLLSPLDPQPLNPAAPELDTLVPQPLSPSAPQPPVGVSDQLEAARALAQRIKVPPAKSVEFDAEA